MVRRRLSVAARSPKVRWKRGAFFKPALLEVSDPKLPIVQQETFGPVLTLQVFDDEREAVTLANDSEFGLCASVWTRDAPRGEQIARRLEVGAVCVNAAQINYYALNLPMGGWKSSGLGTRHGVAGIRKYTRMQSLLVSGFGLRREIFMYPYSRRATALLARIYRTVYGRGRRR